MSAIKIGIEPIKKMYLMIKKSKIKRMVIVYKSFTFYGYTFCVHQSLNQMDSDEIWSDMEYSVSEYSTGCSCGFIESNSIKKVINEVLELLNVNKHKLYETIKRYERINK